MVAKTILNQLQTLTPKQMFWSWGASKFQAVSESANERQSIKGVGEDYMGGLLFYVRGLKHRGHVLITLSYGDTYTVTIGQVRKGEMNTKAQRKDVFFDELPYTIDEMIEDTENNVEKAREFLNNVR